ncbi:MAG: metallophosphoesterase [Planctomycetota bacterium]
MIDNDEARYTKELLFRWKQNAEQEALREIESSAKNLSAIHESLRVATHIGTVEDVNTNHCQRHGRPLAPAWLKSNPSQVCSEWLVERLTRNADLHLFFDPSWCGGIWFVADLQLGDGVVINLDQLADLKPPSPTMTTTAALSPSDFQSSARESESLIQPLYDGPLDIVGDIHGEIAPLRSLLRHLGYDDDGSNPDGRRLVFVGDLTDRGPDSPAVVDFVQSLVESNRAQCVLGNHDLNILLGHRKHDNSWFFGEEFIEDGIVVPQVLADDSIRQQVLAFFATLPIALEREDLRVVHACWNDDMIEMARDASDVVALYNEHHELIEGSFPVLDLDKTGKVLEHQNKNPVKLLSSGPEERTDEPIHASGKIRNERRVQWWSDYDGPFCVFGHYSILDGQPRGNESTFCVDYGVGKRWTGRREGKTSGFNLKLAALRWPERVVVFDEGGRLSAELPLWSPGGGVVLDVHPARRDWQLPSDATPLPSFHVTLIGRKVFLEYMDAMVGVWEFVRRTLPLPPYPELDTRVKLATDEHRKTWFLDIVNQDDFSDYARQLTTILDAEFRHCMGIGFPNAETDRYFHMSIANNQGGDPLKSIGAIRPS